MVSERSGATRWAAFQRKLQVTCISLLPAGVIGYLVSFNFGRMWRLTSSSV